MQQYKNLPTVYERIRKVKNYVFVQEKLNLMQQYKKNSKHNSFLSSHPQVTKRVVMNPAPKLRIPQEQYKKKKDDYYLQQQQMNQTLRDHMQTLEHDNLMFKQSLIYFDPTNILSELSTQLQSLKNAEAFITQQIANCETVEKTTTPEQYFLFKKNKRISTFNQAINEIYDFVDTQRDQLAKAMERVADEMGQIKAEIDKMENQLNHNYFNSITTKDNHTVIQNNHNNNSKSRIERKQEEKQQQSHDNSQYQSYSNTHNKSRNREDICQSRINVIVESTLSSHQHQYQPQHEYEPQHEKSLFSESQSQSSDIDPCQLEQLQDEYKSLLQTYEIMSENNEIMTTQLFNNIETIEEGLYKYNESQTNKLYRELLIIKEDFSYMPLQHIIPPTQTQLNYQVAPLIQDYKNKLNEIKSKLSTDLKKITADILAPLHWEAISIQQYLKVDSNHQDQDKSLKSSSKRLSQNKSQKTNNKSIQQAQNECKKIQIQIRKEDEIISNLQSELQQIMGDTMVFKQKEHQLQLAMHNMKKILKQQQQHQPILF